MDTASELRDARLGAGLTQAALAARSSTSQATISAYEAGTKTPSIATFERLMAALGARLRVEHGRPPVRVSTRREEEWVARTLADVIELAEALPTRHDPHLRFPRLGER